MECITWTSWLKMWVLHVCFQCAMGSACTFMFIRCPLWLLAFSVKRKNASCYYILSLLFLLLSPALVNIFCNSWMFVFSTNSSSCSPVSFREQHVYSPFSAACQKSSWEMKKVTNSRWSRRGRKSHRDDSWDTFIVSLAQFVTDEEGSTKRHN